MQPVRVLHSRKPCSERSAEAPKPAFGAPLLRYQRSGSWARIR